MSSSDTETDADGFKLYLYDPSVAAAVIFTIAFAGVSVRHAQLIFQKKTLCFIPFFIGCLFEAIGYAARAYSASQTPDWTLVPYIVQSLLILLGPVFYAASIYMVFGRLIRNLEASEHSLIPIKWLTKLFLLGDVLSLFGQGGGGGLLAASSSSQNLANNIILLGLGIQVVFFSAFIIVTAVFHVRMLLRPTPRSLSSDMPWKLFLWTLYLVGMLIIVRSVFRMVEYAQGHNGSLLQKEAYVYILDALLMLIVGIVFNFSHPSTVLSWHKKLDNGIDYSHEDTHQMT